MEPMIHWDHYSTLLVYSDLNLTYGLDQLDNDKDHYENIHELIIKQRQNHIGNQSLKTRILAYTNIDMASLKGRVALIVRINTKITERCGYKGAKLRKCPALDILLSLILQRVCCDVIQYQSIEFENDEQNLGYNMPRTVKFRVDWVNLYSQFCNIIGKKPAMPRSVKKNVVRFNYAHLDDGCVTLNFGNSEVRERARFIRHVLNDDTALHTLLRSRSKTNGCVDIAYSTDETEMEWECLDGWF